MAYCSAYYLYQRYEKRGDQDWIPSYPNVYSIDGEGSKPLRARVMYDTDCGWIPDTEVQYRTLSGTPYCTGYDLYVNETYQVSYDGGVTWETTGNEDVLVERNSHDCGYIDPIYRWVTVTPVSGDSSTYVCDDCTVDYRTISGTAYCDGYNKYVDVSSQVSYDGGVHWETTATTATITEPCSDDCMASVPYANQYLTFVPLEECTFRSESYCYYSLDCGLNWERFSSAVTVSAGQKMIVKENEPTSDPSWITSPRFSATGRFKLQGNVMSMMYGDNFVGKTSFPYPHTSFYHTFSGCTSLVDAENLVLPATGLTDYCYDAMFQDCTSLVKAPRELPATTMKQSCYGRMFAGCTSLTTTPAIYGTRLATNCYERMFLNCTSLVNPTNSLTFYSDSNANYCFSAMFSGCTSLTSIPRLGASTNNYMYDRAFYGCTSLTGVTLPFTSIANGNVYQMFDGCTNLRYVSCPATYIGSSSDTYNWLNNVASSGTFIKSSLSFDGWQSGPSGIPYGWTAYPREEWVNSGTTCVGYDKYHEQTKVYYANPTTWSATTDTRVGSLIESDSADCGFVPNPYKNQYLTFEAVRAGTFSFSGTSGGSIDNVYIEYSLDSGTTWETLPRNVSTYTVQAGDKIMWKGNLTPGATYPYQGIGTFSSSDWYNVEGNPMSLLYGNNFSGRTSLVGSSYAFDGLFYGNTGLKSIEHLSLPAKTLSESCYASMFNGCGITSIPGNLLPATTMKRACYNNMFGACRSLTAIPSGLLPALNLAEWCYASMFRGCSGLTTVSSDLLPAETMSGWCYDLMFQNCTSLVTVPADLLPGTTMAKDCYYGMFQGCTSLTTGPDLPASTLVEDCYEHLFYGCTSLNYIKCLATEPVLNMENYTGEWVYNVYPQGTFVVKPRQRAWPEGVDGRPRGWTTQVVTS